LEKLHNEELYNPYSSSNIIRVMKLKSMRWVGHAAHIGQMRNAYKIIVSELKRKNDLIDLEVDWRVILKCK
jgi:hypothetical protein